MDYNRTSMFHGTFERLLLGEAMNNPTRQFMGEVNGAQKTPAILDILIRVSFKTFG